MRLPHLRSTAAPTLQRWRAASAGLVLLVGVASCVSRQPPPPQGPATYVGRATCAQCHPQENDLWRGSDHDLAMQPAAPATVLGDFDNATFVYNGITTTFSHRPEGYFVRTEGADGTLQEFQVAYTFGVRPLQQYLIGFPDGRYQALGIAWDTRSVEAGGQRWFHLYPDQNIAAGDFLHWTMPAQNWNHMCADCHSTDLQKHYDSATDRFATTWSEINVACEACHGPGSHHVAWAQWRASQYLSRPIARDDDMGLTNHLRDRDDGRWVLRDSMVTAHRVPPRTSSRRIETCAPCHARRLTVHAPQPGDALLDNHRLALLTEGLYFPDGQIRDEDYVYGSFLQSRMFHAGVTCSDCHDPHSLRVGFAPDMACNKCHLPNHYASPEHHFHKVGTPGASCVECHMPETTYMVIDPRRDHSIRIPRPDLSQKLGVPNACNRCHDDKSARWSQEAIDKWYGADRVRPPHYGEALAAGFADSLQAEAMLRRVVDDHDLPVFARASALLELGNHLTPASLTTLRNSLTEEDALMRFAGVQASEAVPPAQRVALLLPLLSDPLRLVRAEAAARIAAADTASLPREVRSLYDNALSEYEAMQAYNADRAEAHLNLGVLALQQGDTHGAEAAYRQALALSPDFTEAAINLADLYRHLEREKDCGAVLEQALQRNPQHAATEHALGLQRIRTGKGQEALQWLQRATQHDPHNARYAYVYGVALHSMKHLSRSIAVLEGAHREHPADVDILVALVTVLQESGQMDKAQDYAAKLQKLAPGTATEGR